jgi:primase-polymerase (primpol)-like protein
MTSLPRFVRYTSRKVPRTVAGSSASSIDPATWSSYAAAEASTVGEGIGFVLGDGIGCLDLDHCISNGELEPWADVLLAANRNTYAEISRSGEGLHIFGYLPEGPGRLVRDGRNIEVYSTGRYIALTGNRFGQSPATLANLVVPALP